VADPVNIKGNENHHEIEGKSHSELREGNEKNIGTDFEIHEPRLSDSRFMLPNRRKKIRPGKIALFFSNLQAFHQVLFSAAWKPRILFSPDSRFRSDSGKYPTPLRFCFQL